MKKELLFPIPAGYRLLRANTKIRLGDKVLYKCGWYPTSSIGYKVGEPRSCLQGGPFIYARKIN